MVLAFIFRIESRHISFNQQIRAESAELGYLNRRMHRIDSISNSIVTAITSVSWLAFGSKRERAKNSLKLFEVCFSDFLSSFSVPVFSVQEFIGISFLCFIFLKAFERRFAKQHVCRRRSEPTQLCDSLERYSDVQHRATAFSRN